MQDFDQKVGEDNVRAIEVDGHSFKVIREDPFGFYRISYKGDWDLTRAMTGHFTSHERAIQEIELWAKNIRKTQEENRKAQEEIKTLEESLEEKEAEITEAEMAAATHTIKPKVKKNGKRTTF